MAAWEEVDELEKLQHVIKPIAWKIPDFLTAIEDRQYSCLYSPNFKVAGISFDLTLFKRSWHETDGFLDLSLWSGGEREYSVDFDLGLKKCDGSVESFASGILNREHNESTCVKFIKHSELLPRKSELLPDNVLTITGILKCMNPDYKPTLFDEYEEQYMTSKIVEPEDLPDELKKYLFDSTEAPDVTSKAKDKEYKAIDIFHHSGVATNFKHDTLNTYRCHSYFRL